MPDVVHELIVTPVALEKLGARGIAIDEVGQLPRSSTEAERTLVQ
jgi:hypothetical protein